MLRLNFWQKIFEEMCEKDFFFCFCYQNVKHSCRCWCQCLALSHFHSIPPSIFTFLWWYISWDISCHYTTMGEKISSRCLKALCYIYWKCETRSFLWYFHFSKILYFYHQTFLYEYIFEFRQKFQELCKFIFLKPDNRRLNLKSSIIFFY